MKIHPSNSHVALHLLINRLSLAVQPEAIARQNTLVNEIPPCLLVRTNPSKLGMIIRQILDTVNNNSEASRISLSAKMFGDVLLFSIRKKSALEATDFTECLLPLQKLAKEFYGNVSVTSHRNEVTTVALTGISQPIAA